MRYEDASGAFQASGPIANDDADTLSAGQRGPATGNLITGEGTQYGSAGADNAAGAQITAISGKSGEDSSFSGGKLSVEGEHGRLTVDADGNYSYLANGSVENVRDRFTYTLADNQGNSDTAALIVEIGKTPAVIKANAQEVVPGPDGVVTLPPGVELSDVRVVGRNLVVDLPDGTQLIIIDGAIFVPQLSLGGVEVPATNVAALLIGQEVQPAAGEIPPSGGGNFALPPPPLDPGIPLGDLIPPTELDYTPPQPEEVLEFIDEEPEIFVQPDGQPASAAAVDQVEEAGLPAPRIGNLPNETAGSGESADGNGADNDVSSETTTGTILINSPDGVDAVTINSVLVTGAIGQTIAGAFGTLTITGFSGDDILYSYTLRDNTSGNDTHDDFSVVLTDGDGDTATATLRIDIIDDVPTARADTDAIAAGQFGPATGNIITDASAGDAGDSDIGADTVGADNASITAVSSANVPANSDSSSPFVVNGQYGVLTLQADGSYSYTRNAGTPGGVNDVFNYTLTDGDGDTSTTTLTISIGDLQPLVPTQFGANVVAEAGLPARNGEPAGSGEIADGNGANNSDTSETITGSASVAGGDGPLTVTIDGVALTAVGQTFVKPNGILTITAINAGSIDYTFTLTDNTSGDNTTVTFAVAVTDQDGDTATGNFVVNIVDDVPTAVNDTDAISGGSLGPVTGNVITDAAPGDAGDGDNGADTVGADNATVSSVASNNVPANVDNDPAGGFVVNGQYGVLTLQADGSYSYARNPGSPGGVDDVFTYTLTDGDGDSDTATLTITIGDAPTSIDAPDLGEAGTLVDEQGLPTRNGGEPAGTEEAADGNGADNDDTSETTAGVITFSAPDVPATIRIDGVVVTGTAGQTFNGAHGVLTITSFDAATGEVGYSYTLTDNTSGDATSDDFAIQITDADGDVASDTLVVQILDDAPIAANDTDSIAAGQYGPATGNVITDAAAGDAGDSDNGADNVGADNASVSQIQSNNVPANVDATPSGGNFVVSGQYGVLTIGQDGNYSYVRNPGTAGGVQDVFTYTLTDGDADSTTATLTITISDSPTTIDAPDAGEAGTVVDEQGLPTRNGGEPAGTGEAADGNGGDNDDTSETTAGVITFSAPDGPATVRIDGVIVTGTAGQTFNGTHGVLTITSYDAASGQIGYSYRLTDNTSGDATSDDFAVQITDQDGDVASDTLVVDIIDDTPLATNDVDVIIGGIGPATGNVMTGIDVGGGDANSSDGNADNVGADNAEVTQIQSNNVPANVDITPTGGNFVVNGQYGVLTINENGNYSYLRNAGSPGGVQDVFTYTLTDGDGDIITATLTISIDDNFPTAGNVNVQLDDETLAGGNIGGVGDVDPNTSGTSGNLPGSGGDGTHTFSVLLTGEPAGFDYVSGGAGIVLIQQGGETKITVTVNPNGSYTVVQNNPIDHAPGGNENDVGPLVINYTVSDNDGDTANGTISINVDDDTPTISASTNQPTLAVDETNLAANAGPTSFAGVFTASFGADGQAAVNPSVYTLGINAGVTGIVDTATGQAVVLSMNGGVVEGRTSGSNELVFTVTVDGSGNVTLDQLRAVVHNDPADHDEPGLSAVTLANDNMITLTRTITDGDGDTASATADIGRNLQFEDDGPDAVNDTANQATENTPVNIDVHANDSDGADDVNLATGIQVVGGSLTGTGVLVYNGNGTFTYTPAAGEQGAIQFQYRLTDRDGDSDLATVTINLQPDSTPSAVDGAAAVDDDGLTGGNAASVTGDLNANASPPEAPTVNPSEAIFHGQLVATAGGDTIVDYDFASMDGTSGTVGTETVNYTWNNGSSTLLATGPRGVLFEVVVNQATGEYNLTLRDNVLHAAGNNENDATTNLTFTVTDSDGDPDTGTITVTFDDDAPTIGTIQNGTASNNPAALASTGALNMVIGADSPASVVAISANNTGVTSGGFNLVTNVSGNVLTAYQDVNGNGTYEALTDTTAVYTLTVDPNSGASGRYSFDLITPFDPTVTETLVGGSSSFGAGPTGFQILLNPAGTQELAVVSGYLVDTTLANADPDDADTDGVFDFNTWFSGSLVAADIASAGTNGSVSGWGVENNNFENPDELFFFDFGSQATSDPDAGGPFDPPDQGPDDPDAAPEVQLPNISTATFEFINYTSGAGDAGDDIAYVVHYTDGSFDNGWVPDNAIDGDVQWKFIADPGKFIADIQFFSGRNPSGSVQDLPPGKIDLVSVGVQTSSLTETVGFNVTIADADGDQVSGSFTVNVADGNSPSTATSMEPFGSTKGGSSSMLAAAADEESAPSFTAANENLRWSGNVGNTGITSAMVAASGLAAMSTSSINSFSQPSYDALVQDGFQQLSTQMIGRESVDEGLASISFGSELGGSAVDGVNLSGSSFSFDDYGSGARGVDAMSFGDADPAYVPSYASGEPAIAGVPAFATNVPTVSMASAEMLSAANLDGNVQQGGAVEQVLADALGNSAPTIDGVLANLPGGIAELSVIANLASPDGAGVPAWDMMGHGAFGPGPDVVFKVEAAMIHQDAVQPA